MIDHGSSVFQVFRAGLFRPGMFITNGRLLFPSHTVHTRFRLGHGSVHHTIGELVIARIVGRIVDHGAQQRGTDQGKTGVSAPVPCAAPSALVLCGGNACPHAGGWLRLSVGQYLAEPVVNGMSFLHGREW